jgi:hypothetical protein
MSETRSTMSKNFMFSLTPELDQRLRRYAKERGWSVGAAIRYFIEDGLAGEKRRAKLARQAVQRPDIEMLADQYIRDSQ